MWIHWPFFPKTWTKGHWPLDDLWPHVCWGHMCDSTQGSLCPSPMTIHQCMWIQWSILQNTTYIHTTYIHTTYILHTEWVITYSLTELSSGETKTTLFPTRPVSWILDWTVSRIETSHSPVIHTRWFWNHESRLKIHQSIDTVTVFAKNLNQRSLTPRWPLTPHLLRSHVWLYPRIIVSMSKSHGNTSMYVDTVINFANYHIHTYTHTYCNVLRTESVIT